MRKIYAAFVFIFMPGIALSAQYTADSGNSEISFVAEHAGKEFSGVFNSWKAEITFDANALDESSIRVEIDTSSAFTGNSSYDSTLPGPDWFNIKEFAKALYVSDSITKEAEEKYTSTGTLTIRGKVVPVSFTFDLPNDQLEKDMARTAFSFNLNRLDFDLGLKSDPTAEWISESIKVNVKLNAKKVTEQANKDAA